MLKTYGRRRSHMDERQQERPKKRRRISVELANEEGPSTSTTSLRRTKTEVFDEPTRAEPSLTSPRSTQSEPNIAVRTVSRTYSGPSRSYLASQPILLDNDPDDDDESYADRRARWGVDDSDDLPRLPPNMMNDLKSITELRSSGESRRFLDQVGYLFEGMDPSATLGLRKTSAVELVGKLTEEEFIRKAKAADFFGRIWEVLCSAGSDKIFDIIQVLFASLLAKDATSLSHLAPKLVPNLCAILGRTSSGDLFHLICTNAADAELRKAGLARTDKALATSIRLILTKAGLIDVSLPLLISRVLVEMPTAGILEPTLRSLQLSLQVLHIRLESYGSGLPLTLHPALIPHITNCLRILDIALLRHKNIDMPSSTWSIPLLDLCHVCECRIELDLDTAPCLEMALRVLVSLSHEDTEWGGALLADDFIPLLIRTAVKSTTIKEEGQKGGEREEGEKEGGTFDRSCLALGILTNIAQSSLSSRMKNQIRLCQLNTKCKLSRECLRTCHCSSSSQESALSALTSHFNSHSSPSPSSTLAIPDPLNIIPTSSDAFIQCHLAILFGLFMRHSTPNQEAILSAVGLDELRKCAREFVEVSVMLKGGEGEGEDADIVKDIVRFLEGLDG